MTAAHFSSWQDMVTLRDAMNQLIEESTTRSLSWQRSPQEDTFRLPVDVYRTAEEIVVVASLPGLLPEEVTITIEGDTLTIRGELRPPMENVDYLFQERPYGTFARSLVLNVPVEIDKAEAVFENGVLSLTLPKTEEVKPKSIHIKAK
jgi:HSP20 family protein